MLSGLCLHSNRPTNRKSVDTPTKVNSYNNAILCILDKNSAASEVLVWLLPYYCSECQLKLDTYAQVYVLFYEHLVLLIEAYFQIITAKLRAVRITATTIKY